MFMKNKSSIALLFGAFSFAPIVADREVGPEIFASQQILEKEVETTKKSSSWPGLTKTSQVMLICAALAPLIGTGCNVICDIVSTEGPKWLEGLNFVAEHYGFYPSLSLTILGCVLWHELLIRN